MIRFPVKDEQSLVDFTFITRHSTAYPSYPACPGGGYQKVLVVGADTLSRYVDWTDRGTCILFGDGAGAVVVEVREPLSWNAPIRACTVNKDGIRCINTGSSRQCCDAHCPKYFSHESYYYVDNVKWEKVHAMW